MLGAPCLDVSTYDSRLVPARCSLPGAIGVESIFPRGQIGVSFFARQISRTRLVGHSSDGSARIGRQRLGCHAARQAVHGLAVDSVARGAAVGATGFDALEFLRGGACGYVGSVVGMLQHAGISAHGATGLPCARDAIIYL